MLRQYLSQYLKKYLPVKLTQVIRFQEGYHSRLLINLSPPNLLQHLKHLEFLEFTFFKISINNSLIKFYKCIKLILYR